MTFKTFKPSTEGVAKQVKDLIARGGRIIKESSTSVEIRRMDSIASIDEMGRVEWRSAR